MTSLAAYLALAAAAASTAFTSWSYRDFSIPKEVWSSDSTFSLSFADRTDSSYAVFSEDKALADAMSSGVRF